MLGLMGFMDAAALGRLAYVSRALYVFSHVEDLWKGLVVQVCVFLSVSESQMRPPFLVKKGVVLCYPAPFNVSDVGRSNIRQHCAEVLIGKYKEDIAGVV